VAQSSTNLAGQSLKVRSTVTQSWQDSHLKLAGQSLKVRRTATLNSLLLGVLSPKDLSGSEKFYWSDLYFNY